MKVIVRLMGGLGNQMFQYAFGKNLSVTNNTELVLDKTLLENVKVEDTVRDFELNIFPNINFRWATEDEIFMYNGSSGASVYQKVLRRVRNTFEPKQLVIQERNHINPDYLTVKDNACFVGRWQSHLFFKKTETQIREDFKLQKPIIDGFDEMLDKIKNSSSVCVHVRRGDLVTNKTYNREIGALPREYYQSAFSLIREEIDTPYFFIFSDDPEWCQKYLLTDINSEVVSEKLAGKCAVGHFYLMQQCKHFVISNSTFAWWAAYLASGDDKKVFYPDPWNKDPSLANPQMCPPEWYNIPAKHL